MQRMSMRGRILLVVDEQGCGRLLPGLILRPFGFTVIECASGLEAIELLPNLKLTVALISFRMSGLNGLDVLQHMRQDPQHIRTPAIACIARAACLDERVVLSKGFDAVLLKPFRSLELLDLIKKW